MKRLTADQQAASALSYLDYTKGIESGDEDELTGVVGTKRELTSKEQETKEAALECLRYYFRYTPQEFSSGIDEKESGGLKCSALGLFAVLVLGFAAYHVSYAVITLLLE